MLVKLPGDVKLDPATGQITTVFDNLPQVPFTSFALTLPGRPAGRARQPAACGTKDLTAVLTPWSGTRAKTASASFTIDADGHGGACTAAAFSPALRVAADSTAAGRPAGAVTLEVSRPDGSQDLTRVTTELPPGLAGSLKGVPVCADAAADAGACPAGSRVGSVSSLAGTRRRAGVAERRGLPHRPDRRRLRRAGDRDPRQGRAGRPRHRDRAREHRAARRRRADRAHDPLPRLIGGVPVSIRQLALTFDRPGFILNASSCAPQQVRAVLEGADGATATVTAPYQATDCAGLPFSPRIEATIGKRGQTAKGKAAGAARGRHRARRARRDGDRQRRPPAGARTRPRAARQGVRGRRLRRLRLPGERADRHGDGDDAAAAEGALTSPVTLRCRRPARSRGSR